MDQHITIKSPEQDQLPASLPALAEQINAEHRQAVAALNDGLEHAHRGGELLRRAKAKCPHGGFSEWLRKNFEGSERTAQMYMQIAKRWPQIEEAKAQRIALLTYSGAIKLLTAPSRHARRNSKSWSDWKDRNSATSSSLPAVS